MKHIVESLKSEFITINDDDTNKKYVVRVWHFVLFVAVVAWLIG